MNFTPADVQQVILDEDDFGHEMRVGRNCEYEARALFLRSMTRAVVRFVGALDNQIEHIGAIPICALPIFATKK